MKTLVGEKALILNKTNGKAVAKLYGKDTRTWIGKPLTLVATEVDFRGDLVDAIRVRTAQPASAEVPFNDEINI